MRRGGSRVMTWVGLGVVLVGTYGFWATQPPGGNTATKSVTIPRGASLSRAAETLERNGVIRSAAFFRLLAQATGRTRVHAGTFPISPSWPPDRILSELQHAAPERDFRVTFPEGFTLEQIAHRAAELPNVREGEFLRLATMRGKHFHCRFALPPKLEGYLFPDTYEFGRTATETAVIQRMLDNFDDRVSTSLAGDFAEAQAAGRKPHEILTMASMVESEAKVKSDQPLIAGVLTNRLARGMPLQIDATVQYVIGHRPRVLYRDLEVNSPYNTYKITGLPPGPICSPGLPAIRAALHPASVPYLYYTAKADGTHTFTNTLADHIKATRQARAESSRKEAAGG